MKRIISVGLAAVLALAAAPALADDARIAVTNNASQAVEQVVVFHLDEDGSVIDDVVGGYFDPIAPGEQVVAPGGPCGPSSIYVRLASGEELSAELDSCANPQLVVSD